MIRAYLAQLLAKLMCWRFGHKRGKRFPGLPISYPPNAPFAFYACPRCGAQWKRHIKVKS
jgi:hypothetical protein